MQDPHTAGEANDEHLGLWRQPETIHYLWLTRNRLPLNVFFESYRIFLDFFQMLLQILDVTHKTLQNHQKLQNFSVLSSYPLCTHRRKAYKPQKTLNKYRTSLPCQDGLFAPIEGKTRKTHERH
jgi:hypothetical protein